MNERIKELAEQAGFKPFEVRLDDAKLEKFAELIVRECIEAMRLVPYESDREFGDEVIYQEAVKKHFGVD